ncbi:MULTISPECIES: Tat pathway signal sequence domain protein [Streptomyces]|uniref:Sortase-dependent protein n=1 Tax=Streptomyces lienomycini TaxID=284035 RepID=A0ABV9WWN5_9ACTN|nr:MULTISPECIES: Tat pathway signal sequence domain protein [Streptomyces]
MRRTILSAVALACTAVLAGTAPAFADDPTPVPAAPAESAPSAGTEPREASPVPSVSVPAQEPTQAPAPAPAEGQVSVVPRGAADTGVAPTDTQGTDQGLIGAGAGGVLLAGGVVLFVVHRRRAAATGA